MRTRFLILAALLLACAPAHATETARQPTLRIEAGMDTGTIWRIATDREGRWAATASEDKTVRVWDLPGGNLRAVMRPPIADGNPGKLFAVAMSPDGTRVAASGWTALEGHAHSVYLFERTTGNMLQVLSGASNVVKHLAYSSDGRWLAAALGGNAGIALWPVGEHDAAESRAVQQTEPYGSDSLQVAFAPDSNTLASTSLDGKVRVYRIQAGRLQLQASATAPGGHQPVGIAFNPNGALLAIGYADAADVDVLKADTLTRQWSAPGDNGGSGEPSINVAWSQDGQNLYGAGAAESGGFKLVRRWGNGGHAKPVNIPSLADTILGLAALPKGGLLVAGAGPEWGLVDARDRWLRLGNSPVLNFRSADPEGSLEVSRDGRVIRVALGAEGREGLQFDLAQRKLLPSGDHLAASPRAVPMALTEWDSGRPLFKGHPLPLGDGETALSVALDPDGSGLALGTRWSLRNYDGDGHPLWTLPTSAPVRGVRQTAEGKLLVATLGDGTVRWYRRSDGHELLALFVHADRKRWVVWTPSGYFDASPGGDGLIGWHLNRGQGDPADFFPAARLRDRFHRADVIDLVLATLDEAAALAQASRSHDRRSPDAGNLADTLPPIVELLSASELSTDQDHVTLTYRLRSAPDAPVLHLRARVNGQIVAADGSPVQADADGRCQLRVALPSLDSTVELFAENRHGVSSPAGVRVHWTGKSAGAGNGFVIQPTLYVLAVGIGNYQAADIPHLDLPAKDAVDFARVISGQRGKLYKDVVMRVLTDEGATKDNIMDGLEWLQKQVTQHDVGMLFLAGHGVNDPVLGYTFLPVNATLDRLKRSGVSMADIRTTLANLTGKAVFFLDTCHSGNVLGGARRSVDSDLAGVVNELASAENGVVVFSSSTGRQNSLEDTRWGNGAFTKALIEGLEGRADYQRNGRITHKMLDLYVSERVKELTDGQQSPVTQAPGGVPDFPLAILTRREM